MALHIILLNVLADQAVRSGDTEEFIQKRRKVHKALVAELPAGDVRSGAISEASRFYESLERILEARD